MMQKSGEQATLPSMRPGSSHCKVTQDFNLKAKIIVKLLNLQGDDCIFILKVVTDPLHVNCGYYLYIKLTVNLRL